MAKITAAPALRYVSHPRRPEWGVGQVLDDQNGLVRVAFTDGVVRSFRGDVLAVAATPEGAVALTPNAAEPAPAKPRRAATRRVRKPA